MKALTYAVAGMLALAPVAAAQTAEPLFGRLTLEAGFTPDPSVVPVRGGGPIDGRQLRADCVGGFTNQASVTLDYTTISTIFPLIISTRATDDTTLMVRGPDGVIRCDDDGGLNGGNASIRYDVPEAGAYQVWVGRKAAGEGPVRLYFSELQSQ